MLVIGRATMLFLPRWQRVETVFTRPTQFIIYQIGLMLYTNRHFRYLVLCNSYNAYQNGRNGLSSCRPFRCAGAPDRPSGHAARGPSGAVSGPRELGGAPFGRAPRIRGFDVERPARTADPSSGNPPPDPPRGDPHPAPLPLKRKGTRDAESDVPGSQPATDRPGRRDRGGGPSVQGRPPHVARRPDRATCPARGPPRRTRPGASGRRREPARIRRAPS